jgi:tetratricopeptide (TPR) repeat protein
MFRDLSDEASKAFRKKDWGFAAARFNDAAEYLLKVGYPRDDELVATCRYNVAMAYFNARRYKEAEEILRRLLEVVPKYNPSVVKEQLAEAGRMSKLFNQ